MENPKNEGEDYQYEDFDQETDEEQLQRQRDKWNPVLLEAIKTNNLGLLDDAYNNGAEVNYADKKKWDGITWASCKGHYEALRYLQRKSAFSFYNNLHFTRREISDDYEVLLGKFNEKPDNNPLQWACLNGHSDCVALLIKEGFSWKKLDQLYNNCLHLAASSNDLKTVEILLQTGVDVRFKNNRGHTAIDVTTDKRIKELLMRYKDTKECAATKRPFNEKEVKYLCTVCKKFLSKDGCSLIWVHYESTDTEIPISRCVDCYDEISKAEKQINKLIDMGDLNEIQAAMDEIKVNNVQIDHKLDIYIIDTIKKLGIIQEIEMKLTQITHIDDYKTIKKHVFMLQKRLDDCVDQDINLPPTLITKVELACKRLTAERNLRYFFEIAETNEDSKLQFEQLIVDAETNGVEATYLEKGRTILSKIQRNLRAIDLLTKFEDYALRVYPPDPIWDPRGKRYLDAVTKKPIDLKKPQILPLNPPKKKKKKNQEPEFVIPGWAFERKQLISFYKELDELIKCDDLELDDIFKKKCAEQIARMTKENKYRLRIEQDMKIIEEYRAKKKKNK